VTPHILVVRPGAIGDALLAFPALAALRRARPHHALTFIAHPAVRKLALGSGLADLFISRDDPRSDALFSADPENALESFRSVAAAVVWTSRQDPALRTNLLALGAEPIVMAASRSSRRRDIHVAQHLLDTLAPFGVRARTADWSGFGQLGGRPSTLDGLLSSARDDRLLSQAPFVVLHPGSGSRRKNWPATHYAKLADALWQQARPRICLLVGEADEEARDVFQAHVQAPYTALVEQPLDQLAPLLAHCSLYVGNDSAISHLAGLCGAPTLALFGPTDPRLWSPLGRRVQVLRREPLESLDIQTVLAAACLAWERSDSSKADAELRGPR
jgi:ADP-heptose:LPS heptosyltransferase